MKSKSLNIPQTAVKSVIYEKMEYDTDVNLPRADRPDKLSDYASLPEAMCDFPQVNWKF